MLYLKVLLVYAVFQSETVDVHQDEIKMNHVVMGSVIDHLIKTK